MTKIKQFQKIIVDGILDMGAIVSEVRHSTYEYSMATDAGRLSITIHGDDDTMNVYCKFADVNKALEYVACNRFSGKWNFHLGTVRGADVKACAMDILRQIQRIIIEKVVEYRIPTIEDMTWQCPECKTIVIHDYDALCNVGTPICCGCAIDMERKDPPAWWVGVVKVTIHFEGLADQDKFYYIPLVGREWKNSETRQNRYIIQAMERTCKEKKVINGGGTIANTVYQHEFDEDHWSAFTLKDCKESGLHDSHKDASGHCLFCEREEQTISIDINGLDADRCQEELEKLGVKVLQKRPNSLLLEVPASSRLNIKKWMDDYGYDHDLYADIFA